jgi:orsellinic acid C2-O-methyltransferase
MDPSVEPNGDSADRIADLLDGYILTQIITTAVRLSIFDKIAEGHEEVPDLALHVNLQAKHLRRLARALAGLALLEQTGPDSYRNTAMTDVLRRDNGTVYGYALLSGRPYYELWEHLDFALRSGRSAAETTYGHGIWEHLDSESDLVEAFARTMGWQASWALDEIMQLCEIPADGIIADIGAGDGALLVGILQRNLAARGVAFEQPGMIPHTRSTIEAAGLLNRCNLVSGSFFDGIPVTADLYILQSVLHNWGDDDAVRLLTNCRRAMPERARLLVVEHPLDEGNLLRSAIKDLTMLVLFGSGDRTVQEYCALLNKGGFAISRYVHSRNGMCVIEASAAQVPSVA